MLRTEQNNKGKLFRIGRQRSGRACLALGAAASAAILISSRAADAASAYWNGVGNNSTATGWNDAGSWNSSAAATAAFGAIPGASDTAIFNITSVTTAQTVDLNASQSIGGLVFLNNSGATVSIQNGTGTNTLSLGTGGILVNASGGTPSITCTTLALGSTTQTWTNNDAGAYLTIGAATTGTGLLTLVDSQGSSSSGIQFNGSLSGFTGTMNVSTSSTAKVVLAGGDSPASAQIINVGSSSSSASTLYGSGQTIGANVTLNLYGHGNTENLGALRLDGTSTVNAAVNIMSASTALGGNSGSSSINGILSDGGFGFTKLGGSTISLTNAANAITGNINISGGTLKPTVLGAIPSTTIIGFTNTTATAGLDITGIANQTLGGMVFATQTTGTNTVTITGNSSSGLTVSPATLTFAPSASGATSALTVTMATLGNFTYNNSSGSFNVQVGSSSATTGSSSVTLATTNRITASSVNIGDQGGLANGGAQPLSTLNLGTTATIDTSTLNVAASGSRASGTLLAGSGILTIAGVTGGTSTANMVIGKGESFQAADIDNATFNASAGTLNAQFGSIVMGQESAGSGSSSGRGVTINANLIMGAGTLSANSLNIGNFSGAYNAGTYVLTSLLNEVGPGSASIGTITFGNNTATVTTGATTNVTLNDQVTINGGAKLFSTTIGKGGTGGGTVNRTDQINFTNGSIGNITGTNLNISGVAIVTSGATNTHAFNISSGQAGNISSIISGAGLITTTGPGTLLFSAANTYTGGTNISAGTFVANNSTGSATGTGTVNLIGATLASGTVGTINGTVVADGASTIAPGGLNTTGLLTIGSLNSTSGAILNFDLGSTPVSGIVLGDQLNISNATSVTASGTAIAFNTSTTVLGYDYRLIGGSGVSALNISNFTLPTAPNGQLYSLSTTADPGFVDLAVFSSTAGANLIWDNIGTGDSITWDTTNQNWNNSGTAATFSSINQDIANFTDDNAGAYNVTISGPVTPGYTNVNAAGTYTFSGPGGIGGIGGLNVSGGGTLVLGTANTFSGPTAVSGATLDLANSLALQNSTLTTGGVTFDASVSSNIFTLGGLSGSGNITLQNTAAAPITLMIGANGTTTTYSGSLNGSGGIVKVGGGMLTLSGSNTYAGSTTVNGGTLQMGSATAIPAGTSLIYSGTSTLDLNSNPLSVSGVTIAQGATGTLANGTLNLGSGSVTFLASTGSTSALAGGILSINGATIDGTAANGTSAVTGLFENVSSQIVGTGGLTIKAFGNTSDNGGGVNAYVTISNTSNSFVGGVAITKGLVNISVGDGPFGNGTSLATNAITISSGAGLIAPTTVAFNTSSIILAGAGDHYLRVFGPGTATATINGAISGTDPAAGLHMIDAGTTILAGSNTYTGVTTVNDGIVTVTGNESAANGGWTIGSHSAFVTTVNFNAGSSVSIAPTAAVNLGTLPGGSVSSSNASNLNVTTTVSNLGTLAVGRNGNLNINNGGSWTQTGPMNIQPVNGSGFGAFVTVNTGGTFIYNGSNPINLTPSITTGGAGAGQISIAGGTFNTSQGFSDGAYTPASLNSYNSPGSAILSLTNGGTLMLSANIANLTSTNGSNFSITLGNNSGGIINTNGFNTSISAVISNASGGGILTKTGAGNLTLTGANNNYSGGTFVNNGTLVLASAGAFPAGTSLNVSSGAAVQVADHGSGPTFVPTMSSLSNSGTIDITNNAMIVHNGSIGTLSGQVSSGYNSGNWNGTSGSGVISSTFAASDSTHLTAVGVATGITGTFEGASVTSTDVLVKYTYYGDANLDGSVSSADYTLIDAGYLSGGTMTGWQNGDFNYDGVINGSDYTLIDNAFNMQGAQLSTEIASATDQIAGGATSAVPEPASLGLLGIGAVGLLGRRNRRRH